ncbi:MAG: universal stress protein [Actinomycetota bacterium]
MTPWPSPRSWPGSSSPSRSGARSGRGAPLPRPDRARARRHEPHGLQPRSPSDTPSPPWAAATVTTHENPEKDGTSTAPCGPIIQADLCEPVVIGRHGHRCLVRLVLGSVTNRLVRHADRPVLVVPPAES